jgi:hypothetical protein
MIIPARLSIKAASLCGLALSIGVSSTAFALPPIANVAVGNGVTTNARALDVPVGGPGRPALTVTALSPHTSKDGSAGNVILLNNQRLVGVTGAQSDVGNGVGVANPTGRPVLSSLSNVPELNGSLSPH